MARGAVQRVDVAHEMPNVEGEEATRRVGHHRYVASVARVAEDPLAQRRGSPGFAEPHGQKFRGKKPDRCGDEP